MTISFFFVLGEDITGYHKKAMVTDDCLGDRRGSGGEVDSYGYVVVVKIRRKKKKKKGGDCNFGQRNGGVRAMVTTVFGKMSKTKNSRSSVVVAG